MPPTESNRPATPTAESASHSAMLCSDADLAVQDDPRGSAATFTRFLLIDHPTSFGPEAADDALRAVYGEQSPEVAALPGLRAFAIRPVGRAAATLGGAETTLSRAETTLSRAEGTSSRVRWVGRAGADGTLEDVTTPPTPAALSSWEPTRPTAATALFAVCTNGSRDRCCAIKGRDLAAQLHHTLDDPTDAPTVVEISHLGGHRFAPTMLVLPWAYAYAWLDADTALEIAYAAQDGLVHPSRLRGRADLAPTAQAAEAYWRTAIGPAPAGAVHIESHEVDGDVHTVTARVQGRTETLTLNRAAGPTIGATVCGGKPIPTGRWQVI